MVAPVSELPSFERALDFVLEREAGYSNHPADPGGETNLGITKATLERAIAANLVPPETTVRTLTRPLAAGIYLAFYWEPARCSDLPGPLALLLFDVVVNAGIPNGVRLFQRALRVDEDGQMGRRTIDAAWSQWAGSTKDGQGALLDDVLGHRLNFYRKNKTADTFFLGWSKRVLAAQRAALGL